LLALQGIYFADMSSKSANYCNAQMQQPEGLLLLCEVSTEMVLAVSPLHSSSSATNV
jgi:hypothetical protein